MAQAISKMETTQTATQWLIEEIDKNMGVWIPPHIQDQAKQMEKEQMHKCASFWRGKENEIEKPMFEQYYNETYNK